VTVLSIQFPDRDLFPIVVVPETLETWPIIHFEEADSAERTQIGEALVKFARQADRLATGRSEGKYFLTHMDGCAEDGEPIEAGDPCYFDTETGESLCEDHGRPDGRNARCSSSRSRTRSAFFASVIALHICHRSPHPSSPLGSRCLRFSILYIVFKLL
jgi:hypothetical protein